MTLDHSDTVIGGVSSNSDGFLIMTESVDFVLVLIHKTSGKVSEY